MKFNFLKSITISGGIKKVLVWYTSLVLASVLIFMFALKLSFIDAFYFVVTTTTTVGFGDFNFQNSPIWIKLYGCFIMIAGAALLATLFSVLTDNIISKRLGRFVNRNSRKVKDHIIVAGVGSIGLGVIKHLMKFGIKTLVIEKNPENPNIHLFRNKVPVLIGDASDHNILMKAGIKKAKAFAALIDDDLNNINIILKAKSFNSDLHTVARIFNSDLHKKANSTFDIDNIVAASTIAVPFILSSLLQKKVAWAGYIQNGIYTLFVEKGSESLRNAIREFGLIPVFKERKGIIEAVTNNDSIKNDDKVYLFGDYGTFTEFYKKFNFNS
jgi:Trk K+ transport system NAD-binding subunit